MKESASWYHSNRCNAQTACEHCGGLVRHEHWCITRDPIVYYAYNVVVHPEKLSPGDVLILHSLGVTWGNAGTGGCKAEQTAAAKTSEAPFFDL